MTKKVKKIAYQADHLPPVSSVNAAIEQKMTGMKNWMIWLLIIIAFIAYANTINHDYAYDDYSVIKNNTIVSQGVTAIPEIFSTPYRWGFFRTSNDTYRPLSLVMFAIEYQAFDGDPAISHLLNVLIYVCCVVMLFVFLDIIFDKKKTPVAFIASLLFALHPVHTEVVANIKSRDELLCFFFALSSLVVFVKYIDAGRFKQLLTGTILFFLSLLSKETSVSLLFIIPLLFFVYKNDNRRRSISVAAGGVFATILFLAIRYAVLSAHEANNIADIKFIDNFLAQAPSTSIKIATAVFIMGIYLKMLVIPYPLISDYSFNSITYVHLNNIWVLLILLVYALLLVISVYRLIKYKYDTLALGILLYLFLIALFSNLLFLTGAAIAERFLFFPSVGFCLCVAALLERRLLNISSSNIKNLATDKVILWIIISVSALFFIITVNRNSKWKDNFTLFSADAQKLPGNAKLNYFLGNEILTQINAGQMQPQEFNAAIEKLYRAVNIYPQYTDAYKALGKGYSLAGRFDSAEYCYKRVINLDSNDIEAWSDLDVIYFRSARYNESILVCKKLLVTDTSMKHKYKNIATCFMKLQQVDSAVFYLQQGIRSSQNPSFFYNDLAMVYRLIGREDSAHKYELLK